MLDYWVLPYSAFIFHSRMWLGDWSIGYSFSTLGRSLVLANKSQALGRQGTHSLVFLLLRSKRFECWNSWTCSCFLSLYELFPMSRFASRTVSLQVLMWELVAFFTPSTEDNTCPCCPYCFMTMSSQVPSWPCSFITHVPLYPCPFMSISLHSHVSLYLCSFMTHVHLCP